MVMAEVQDEEENYCHVERGAKRTCMYVASILPGYGPNSWSMVGLHRKPRSVQSLVYGPVVFAQNGKIAGTIRNIEREKADLCN